MKKTLFFLGLLLSFAFLNAQISAPSGAKKSSHQPVEMSKSKSTAAKTQIPKLHQLQVSDVTTPEPTRDGWLTWANDPVGSVVGANGVNMAIFHRYAVSDLTDYVGSTITKVKYMPYNHPDGPTTFTANPKIQIYVGGSVAGGVYNPGTLAVDYTVPSYTFNSEQTIDLPTPFTITGTQEVWIGIYYSTTAGYPGCSTNGAGTGSYLEGKSNIFYVGGTFDEWGPSSEMFNPPNNKHCWTHAAFVVTPQSDCDPATNLTAAHDATGNQLTWQLPAGKNRETILSQDFESLPDGDTYAITGWTFIDADGDANGWYGLKNAGSPVIPGHSGSGHLTSASWINTPAPYGTALTPNNYVITPLVTGATSVKYWVCGQDASYPAEHYAVCASTTGTAAADFTIVFQETMTAKGGDAPKGARGTNVQGTWYERTVNLPAETKYIAWRHFNCTDKFRLNLDDITVFGGDPIPSDLTVNIYRDGTKIASNITGTSYHDDYDPTLAVCYKVEVNCDGGGNSAMSNQACVTAVEGDCDPATNLAVTKVGNNAELTWNAPAKGVEPVKVTIVNDEIQVVTESIEKIATGSMQRAASINRTPVNNTEVLSMAPAKGKNIIRGNFVEDVESHADFTINSTVNGWSYIDGDGSIVWGMQDADENSIEWPGSGDPQAFIVFNPNNTVPSLGGDSELAAHSGNKFFACVSAILPAYGYGGTGPNNDWLISPELSEPTKLSFYAKTYDDYYGKDRMKVGYSTTGTAQSNFTFLTGSTYVQVPTTWTLYEYTLPAGTKYIAINCVSSDAFIFMVDDITIEQSGADLVKYNIYRDGVLVKGNHTSTSYTDAGIDFTQDHDWCVKVACPTGGESADVCFEIPGTGAECLPATITDVAVVSGCNRITWTMPAGKAEVKLTQGGDPGDQVFGGGSPTARGSFHRFTPADLVAVKGGKLTHVAFVSTIADGQGEPKHTYSIRVYKGGTWSETPGSGRNPGELVFEQFLDNADLDFDYGEDNVIALTTPVTISGTEELWIGYYCTPIPGMTGMAYPCLVDAAPAPFKDHLGNITLSGATWRTLNEGVTGGYTRNWYLYGKAQVTPPSVNIYRNDVLIKSTVEGTFYLDCSGNTSSDCYEVEVNCSDGSTSILSNRKCLDAIKENVKTAFSIVPNPATGGSIKITSGANFHTLEMISFLGQTVLSQPNAGNTTTVDVSNLPNGVYFVRIISEQGTSVQKFVKQ